MTEPETPALDESTLPEPLDDVVEAMRDKKAEALTLLDLRESGAFTDYFLICSGRSTR